MNRALNTDELEQIPESGSTFNLLVWHVHDEDGDLTVVPLEGPAWVHVYEEFLYWMTPLPLDGLSIVSCSVQYQVSGEGEIDRIALIARDFVFIATPDRDVLEREDLSFFRGGIVA